MAEENMNALEAGETPAMMPSEIEGTSTTEPTETDTVETTPGDDTSSDTPEDSGESARDTEAKTKKAKEDFEYWNKLKRQARDDYFKSQRSDPEGTRQPTQEPTATTRQPEAKQDTEPAEEEYENYSDWVREHNKWAAREESRLQRQENDRLNAQAQQQKRQREMLLTWEEKKDAALANDSQLAEKGFIPPELIPLIYNSDHIAEFGYFFADNPGTVNKLLRSDPIEAAREIGRLEAKFASTPPQRSETKAPSSTKPVGSGEAPSKKLEDMTTAEYIAYRNKQEGIELADR